MPSKSKQSKIPSILIKQKFFGDSKKERHLCQIEIQDRDISYRITLNQNGFQSMQAARKDVVCAQVSVIDSEAKAGLRMESEYKKNYKEGGYVEMNSGSDGMADSILMFVKDADQAVDSVLSFDLFQQHLGLWSDSHWIDLQITQNGLQYVRYISEEQNAYKNGNDSVPSFVAPLTVVIDGQAAQPVPVQKKLREVQSSSKKDSTQAKELELLAIVAQLSESERSQILDKWMLEARKLVH